MKQNDFNQPAAFVRPGQPRMQPNGFAQPGQRLPPNRVQQPAPTNYVQQDVNQLAQSMFPKSYATAGQQAPNGGWIAPNYKDPGSIRDVLDEEKAQNASDKMTAMIEEMNGIDPELAEVKVGAAEGAGTVDVVCRNLNIVIDSLVNPDTWVPKSRSQYIPQIKAYGKKLAAKLQSFNDEIIKLR